MDDIRGNLKRRTHAGGRYVPRASLINDAPASLHATRPRPKPLNRAKQAPIKHKTVGLQSPIVLQKGISEIFSEITLKARKLGKVTLKQLKSIPKSPVKSIATGLIVLSIIPFALRMTGNRASKDVEGAKTSLGEGIDISPLTPKDSTVADGTVIVDQEKGSATYQDTYLDAPLTVSQQLIPDDFKKNPDRLREVAASVGAKEEFKTRFGEAYLGTADGDNAVGQRLAFVTDDLLIFINAASKFTTAQWTEYINSLE